MSNWKRRLGQNPGPMGRLSMVVVSTIALNLTSCTTPSPSTPSESPGSQAPPVTTGKALQVVTTFLPITQFTTAVAGDRAEVTQLLPPHVGPHDYQAKPADAQNLAQADVLVKNGLAMEMFLEDLVKNAGNPSLKLIDSSQGVRTITTAAIAADHHDPDHGHSHHPTGEETEVGHDHQHGLYNPHIWLDPKWAIQQVENIRDGLIAADPEGREIYAANAAAYIQQLQELDAETTQLLQPFAGKTFVAFHDIAPYFAESYNLTATFLVDVPEENPSPEDVKRVMDTVRTTHLKTLLADSQASLGGLASLAKDLEVQVSIFDPIETGGPEAGQPDDYLTTMRQNVKALVSAFTGHHQP